MKLVDLSLDEFISWRRVDRDVCFSIHHGDPVVITVSPNGNDARSHHISTLSEPILIPARHWYSAVTLGVASTIKLVPEDHSEDLAPEDWRPVPRDKKG
jgi:hypothetical protein